MSRILLLVDAGSLLYGVYKAHKGKRVNYGRLLEWVRSRGEIVRSICYGRYEKDNHIKFAAAVEHLGFETNYKEKRNVRTSNNVEMFADLVRAVQKNLIDEVVLCSSDPDLIEALRWAREEGIKTTILSIGINRGLRHVASLSVEIPEDMLDEGPSE